MNRSGPQAYSLMSTAVERHQAGRLAEAISLYRKLLKRAPAEPEAWYALGLAQMQSGDSLAASQSWLKAVKLRPDYGPAWVNLGNAQAALALPEAAEASFRKGIALLPELPEAHGNLAIVLGQLDRAGEGEQAARRVLELRPDDPGLLNNLGMLLHQQGRLEEAEATYRRSLAMQPDNARASFNLSLVLLHKGDWAEGWALREARLRGGVGNLQPRSFAQPEWAGEDIAGKTILLYAEQGFGDSLQFLRFCADIAAKVIVEVPRPLVRLASTAPGVAQVVMSGDKLPEFGLQLPLMSLPRILKLTVETIPAHVPYLSAPASDWGKRLAAWPGKKVGLVWSGDPRPHDPLATAVDRRRSIALATLKPLLETPGVTFVSLQKGAAAEQVRKLEAALRPREVMEGVKDFADTAALVDALDLVVTVDTAVAHLAGALGKPVWILSRFDGCWRWLAERDDTPWYPTARLFRQDKPGDWEAVVERLVQSLRHFLA